MFSLHLLFGALLQSVCVTEEQLMGFDRPLGNGAMLSQGDEK